MPILPRVSIAGFRRVQLLYGESLQQLAARELGDAAQWTDIAAINDLMPPYVTGDPDVAGPRVARYGDTLIIPAPKADIEVTARSAEDVLKRDVQLAQGRLTAKNGDFALVAGRDNLHQALGIRVRTEPGELLFHPTYGCAVVRMKGKRSTPLSALFAAKYVESAVRDDPRIASVTKADATVQGDAISVEVTGITATGHPLNTIVDA